MSSMWKLPEEIQVDIFLRLPVNSILACRCVCKPLCSLLSKPSFIKNHLNGSIQSHNPRLLFGYCQYDQGKNPIINSVDYKSVSSSLASDFSEEKVVSVKYPFEKIHTETIVTLGSCNGLVCLGICNGGMGIDEKNWICIWNPSTGEYRNIKVSRSEFWDGWSDVRYGFGYDSNIDDYKLVRISGNPNWLGKHIQVYTLGSKCWKTNQSTDRYLFPGRFHKSIHGVLIKDALHWSGARATTQGTSSKLIVCFDINSQTLKDVPFPEETVLNLQRKCIEKWGCSETAFV